MSDSGTDAGRRIRVLSWNIHGGVGTDGRHDLRRIGRVVGDLEPDLAAFQEVDSRRSAAGQPDVHPYLRERVGDHGHEAWALTGADGEFGQILASRFPLLEPQVHDISVAGREPRKVIEAKIRRRGSTLRVIATHLGLRFTERRRQMRWLREIVEDDPTVPLLLLGDFNEWVTRRRSNSVVHVMDAVTPHRTFPSRLPMLTLDRIATRPDSLLARSWIVREGKGASDHLPIAAELRWP